jgi:ABC-type multidrug transport system ATPase subunit
MTPAISADGLTRRYRGHLALDGATFNIEAGAITGLLGRNGAGKPVTRLRHSKEVSTETGAVHRG